MRGRPRPLPPALHDARQMLRRPICVEGKLANSDYGRHTVDLLDISACGCRIGTVLMFSIGAQVVVTIPSFAPMGAKVRWSDPHALGLEFDNTLHPLVVERIARPT